ncbi:hypothetical protein HY838_01105 [Candidatus Azambacteria bacterium]|nr:hypothetical protein [Candidatus Azambacteria bacterium]
MNKNVFKKAVAGITFGFALLPFLALAQVPGVPGPIITSPQSIFTILNNVLNFLAAAVFVIAIIMLLYAAILFLTAGASETVHAKAKSVLMYAIVGIVVALLTYSVIPFIQNFFLGK